MLLVVVLVVPPVTHGGDEDTVGRVGPRRTMGSMAVPDARRA
jgi:hypothetical protein